MTSKGVPRSAEFAFEIARAALAEQLTRIDALDSKAGLLLAADGLIAGLLFGQQTLLRQAPVWVTVGAAIGVLGAFTCALVAFAARHYQLAPEPGKVAELAQAPSDWLQWRFIGNVLKAVDTNRAKLDRKATWLICGQALLLAALMVLGGYFIYALIEGVA